MRISRVSIALLIAALACGKSDIEQKYQKGVKELDAKRLQAGGAPDELTDIDLSAADYSITYYSAGARHNLHSSSAGGGDRRYSGDAGNYLVDVRSYGFKLKDGNKNTLWAVRLYPEKSKVKVSATDQETNPWRIRVEEEDRRAEIKDEKETLLGTITWDGKKTTVTDASNQVKFTKETPKLEQAYGLMLVNMPAPEKYIVIAELMSRGR